MIRIRDDSSGISRIVEYTIIFGIMLLVFGVITLSVDHAVNNNQKDILARNYRSIADRIANAIEETVRFAAAYPNATHSQRLSLPSALHSSGLTSRAQNYYITITNDTVTVASVDDALVVRTLKTLPSDIMISGSVAPLDTVVITYSNENGSRQIRLVLGDESE